MSNQHKVTGKISFVQHDLPALEAGEYRLTITQSFSVTSEVSKEVYPFAVNGERFQLRPKDIVKVFPPDGSRGDFALTLPHLILARETLPWERTLQSPDEDSPNPRPVLGVPIKQNQPSSSPDVAPWLAIMVFDQDDPPPAVQATDQNGHKPVASTLKDLHDDLPANTFSYFSHSNKPLKDLLDYGESVDDPCQVIDIPIALFNQIAPSVSGLPWLAHKRIVENDSDSPNAYSVIIGNRLPAPGKMTTAHLVSLEGLSAYLPDEKGSPSPNIPEGKEFIRLVSLKSWKFTAVGEKVTFSGLLERLNHASPGQTQPVDGLLRHPLNPSITNTLAGKAQSQGYTILPYHTHTGTESHTWYHGPFVPYTPDELFALPIYNPDALVLYDETNGMYDVSYAAAWQIGRLLALANQEFATNLHQWKMDQIEQTTKKAAETYGLKRTERTAYYQKITDILTNVEEISQLNQAGLILPGRILDWLVSLYKLQGVPFAYLLPDPEMLPPESLRFFQVDMNWTASLIDGALSIGRANQSAWYHDLVFTESYLDQIKKAAGQQSRILSGFLLRSQVVKGWWPGIQIDGYASLDDYPAEDTKRDLLRLDAMSGNILLGVFDDIVNRVNIHEPAEGIHFGFSELNDRDKDFYPDNKFKKELKYLTGQKIGQDMMFSTPDNPEEENLAFYHIATRNGGSQNVLLIEQLASGIREALLQYQGLDAGGSFTAAEFALEMVEGVQLVAFRLGEKNEKS